MGKKNKDSLGRALIKDRFSSRKPNKSHDSLLHTSELNDGYDWGRLNLQSVTEESSFEEFLSTAQLAGTEFQAEKLNVSFVSPNAPVVGSTKEERERFERTRKAKKKLIRIPRRPNWDETTTKEELDTLERESFLEWRRNLSLLQEEGGLTLTPYEKNLEFWRQLWRVVERSDVVIQIVDARNPLLFYCEDLDDYIRDSGKKNLLLVNKADLLTETQRQIWAEWFSENNIEAVFFSATQAGVEEEDEDEEEEQDKLEAEKAHKGEGEIESKKIGGEANGMKDDGEDQGGTIIEENSNTSTKNLEDEDIVFVEEDKDGNRSEAVASSSKFENILQGIWKDYAICGKLLGRSELISLFESLNSGPNSNSYITIGLVGYPNVGKSSTINALVGAKRVSVSATPGKTKHFQTMFLSDEIMLCDCPGLVMPSMAESKAAMVLAGVLPPDRVSDLMQPVSLLASLIDRATLQHHYAVIIPPPPEGEPPDRPPTAHEFLGVYAYSRGFMTAGGRADCSRAARYVVKDFVAGRIVYAYAPPGVDQDEFAPPLPSSCHQRAVSRLTPQALRATQMTRPKGQDLDDAFFQKVSLGAHTKRITKVATPLNSDEPGTSSTNKSKPWKDHSEKRNRREKLRRVYRHLDE